MTTAGRSVIIAGATVVIAVLGLCLTGLPYMYGVAISASLAVLVVMLAAVTLLPALLSYLGPEGRPAPDPVPRPRRSTRATAARTRPPRAGATRVQRRPWIAAIAATAVLLALAAPALGMRLGFPDAGNDPPDTMTRQAYDLNTEGFGPGANGPLVVAAELPDAGGEAQASTRSRGDSARDARRRVRHAAARSTRTGNARADHRDPEAPRRRTRRPQDLVNRLRDDVVPQTARRHRHHAPTSAA